MKQLVKWAVYVLAAFAWMLAFDGALSLLSVASDAAVVAGVICIVALATVPLALAMGGFREARKIVQAMFVLAVAVSATACGHTVIQPGHAGIVVDNYGKNRGVQDYTATTGSVWYNPFTTSVLEYPTFVQSVVFTASKDEGKAVNEEITFTNADQMQIAADVSLSYSLTIENLPAFYVKFRSDDLSAFTYGYLRSLMRDKFNETAGHYKIEAIMGDNGPFLAEVKAALQKDLQPFGVKLEAQFGFIGAPRPPAQVIQSINMKVQATQVAIQKQNELVQVQADANKEVAQAEGHARAVLAAATAEASANRTINESLTERLIQLKQLEKWNGTVPQVTGSGGMPFINLK